jgi:hypothetical protein
MAAKQLDQEAVFCGLFCLTGMSGIINGVFSILTNLSGIMTGRSYGKIIVLYGT